MNKNIAVIRGDGIGPEVVSEAIKALDAVAEVFGHSFSYTDVLMGGGAYDKTGSPLPEETVNICKQSDAVLLGAVGGPKWDTLPGHLRPEAGLLGIRSALSLYANIRPALLFDSLKDACPLRPDISQKGIDMIVFRELTGGIYFGKRGREADAAYDTEYYTADEISRIARLAFNAAMSRKKEVISIDKANVLESSRLWREVVHETAKQFPEVKVTDMLVDNAAMQLVKDPSQFDVVLANNMFGDILSDEAAMITGSIGILASASIGDTKNGLYEPIHGSAPDIAGRNIANPIATILSCAMMLRYSFDMQEESKAIEAAVEAVLHDGIRTADIKDKNTTRLVGTIEMGGCIVDKLKA